MSRSGLLLLSLLFFCSGVCALIYQVMWLRMLALVFGVTVYAASTVLASFMGGLAIGSFAAGRVAARLRSPLSTFGFVEIGIGLSALATPFLLDAVTALWVTIHPSLPSSLAFMTLARLVASCLVLIVPTTLMGATLPIVMRSALVRDRVASSRLGLLYAINTAGAITGALTAGFYLVAEVGTSRSFYLAATVNVAVGVVAIVAARFVQSTSLPQSDMVRATLNESAADSLARLPGGAKGGALRSTQDSVGFSPGEEGMGFSPAVSPELLTETQRRAVLWTFALSGLMSLALEILWFRMLVMLLRPTAYAFTVMLAVVLAGLASGSALSTPLLPRVRRWLPILTVLQLVLSLAAVLSLNLLDRQAAVTEAFAPSLVALGIDAYIAPIAIASMLAMLPTTVILGLAFPVGLSLFAGNSPDSSRRIGVFYSLNVCGAIAGSLLGGFVLLPLLGIRYSVIAASSVALASSVVLAASQWRQRANFAGFVTLVGPVAFVMAALNAIDPFALTAGAHRNERLLWREEGVQTTVAIHETRSGRRNRIMYLDGMHQASDPPGMVFVHHRIGAFPVLLHPNPKSALVVGLGGGATAGAVAQFPGMTVDVVELSRAVVGGASFFTHINFDLLTRPNVNLRVDDGRNHLLTTRKKYDVITADIILPRHAGAGSLYSREYFTLVRNALSDGGLALQWNGGEGGAYGMIMRTFLSVFPHTTLWGDGSLMVGSKEPLQFSRSAYERKRRDPQFRKLLDWDFDRVMEEYAGGPPELAQWAGNGPILTDDRPAIEYFLSLPDDPRPLDPSTLVARPSDVVTP